jgi:hypothetical protein
MKLKMRMLPRLYLDETPPSILEAAKACRKQSDPIGDHAFREAILIHRAVLSYQGTNCFILLSSKLPIVTYKLQLFVRLANTVVHFALRDRKDRKYKIRDRDNPLATAPPSSLTPTTIINNQEPKYKRRLVQRRKIRSNE